MLTEAHPAAQGHSTAAGARVTHKVPAEHKAGACHCSRHAGAARAEAQSVRVCVAAPWGPGREHWPTVRLPCVHLHRFAPGTNGRDSLHTRLARLLPAAQNLATCSGRRITQLFNSQGTAKSAGTSIPQGPTSNSLEQNVSEMSQGQQKNRVLFTPFKTEVGHKMFGSFKVTLSTPSPDCEYKISSHEIMLCFKQLRIII